MKSNTIRAAIEMIKEATACVFEDYLDKYPELTEEDMQKVIKHLEEVKETCEEFGT